MKPDTEFVATCLELMEGFPSTITSKSMFGGHGLFCEGLMFALIADSCLYFKVDEQNDEEYTRLNLPKFTYMRSKKPAELNYRLAPEKAFNNAASMRPWIELSFQAAIRADQAKPPSKRKWTGKD